MKSTGRMNLFVRLALITFILFSVLMIVKLRIQTESLRQQTEDLQLQIAQKEDEIEELDEMLNREVDEDYVKQIAHGSMNYCMPDEEIVYND